MDTITTLRPGLLVSLKTSLTGNVTYEKRETEGEHTTADGALRAAWETARTIAEPADVALTDGWARTDGASCSIYA